MAGRKYGGMERNKMFSLSHNKELEKNVHTKARGINVSFSDNINYVLAWESFFFALNHYIVKRFIHFSSVFFDSRKHQIWQQDIEI